VLDGQDARGTSKPGVPGLIEINFQALNVGEKAKGGGINLEDGKEAPSDHLNAGLASVDASIGQVVDKLKSTGLWDSTLLVVTAKHGQNPRVGELKTIQPGVYLDPIKSAGITIAHATLDDVALIWLTDSTQTEKAAGILATVKSGNADAGIDQILWGDSLKAAGLAGYADRTPDLIVTLQPGVVISAKAKRTEHGGFCEDDTHVALILTGGVIDPKSRATVVDAPVKTTQIAVTVIQALGLNAGDLQGAKTDGTVALPNSGLENLNPAKAAAQ
jgi:arylsulfatase A-like enzyme